MTSHVSRLRVVSRSLLGLSAALWLIAPCFVGPGYSAISQSISESAGQGTPHAWIARSGFVSLGCGALLSACVMRANGSHVAYGQKSSTDQRRGWVAAGVGAATLIFGVAMIAAAIWSHSPWIPGVANDALEDFLHSVAASTAGVGIVAATLFSLSLPGKALWWRKFTGFCVAMSLFIPPLMAVLPSLSGLLQRTMFGVVTVWLWTTSDRRE